MSNWPQDTTKGDGMTNKELAQQLDESNVRVLIADTDIVAEAARRLRELPEPTPEPVKDLRWLVERHECLSKHLAYMPGMDHGPWSWDYRGDNTSGSVITGYAARVVVRGIVKAMCDERRKEKGGSWHWRPRIVETEDGIVADAESWIFFGDSCYGGGNIVDTELEAIDALLAAMEEAK